MSLLRRASLSSLHATALQQSGAASVSRSAGNVKYAWLKRLSKPEMGIFSINLCPFAGFLTRIRTTAATSTLKMRHSSCSAKEPSTTLGYRFTIRIFFERKVRSTRSILYAFHSTGSHFSSQSWFLSFFIFRYYYI